MSVIRHPNTAGATLTQWRYTATGGETSLSGTDGFSTALSYTVGSEQVFINGVLLERGVDYVATTGTTITGLTALVASDIATVVSPSSFNVANAIPLSTVTAKGDLIVGTGASTETALNVGADGTTLVANSSSSTGVAWAGPLLAAGKNKIINGDFGIWQRGTSFSNPAAGTYTADRFVVWHDGSGATRTISQQAFTPGTAPVTGYEGSYFFRYDVSAVGTGNTYQNIEYPIENVRTLAGQTATISFWAKAASSRNLSFIFAQQFGSGGSSDVTFGSTTVALTTSWQRFTTTVSVPSISGKTIGGNTNQLHIYFQLGALSGITTVDLWGVQVEAGSVATTFQTATGTLQGELAACQRYYEIGAWVSSNNLGTQSYPTIYYKVTKRAAPTITNTGSLTAGSTDNASGWYQASNDSGNLIRSWTASAEL